MKEKYEKGGLLELNRFTDSGENARMRTLYLIGPGNPCTVVTIFTSIIKKCVRMLYTLRYATNINPH